MVTKRSSEIPPFIVMEVMEKAASMEREGADIIHLEVGEPDFDTPEDFFFIHFAHSCDRKRVQKSYIPGTFKVG